jgi:hypothetical protein
MPRSGTISCGPYSTVLATLLMPGTGDWHRYVVITRPSLLRAVVRPDLIICLGNAAAKQPPAMRRQGGLSWDDLIQWDRG